MVEWDRKRFLPCLSHYEGLQIDLYLDPALFCVGDPGHVRAGPLKVISIPKSDADAAVAQSTIQIFAERTTAPEM